MPPREPASGDYERDRQRHLRARHARIETEVAMLGWPLPRLWELRDRRLRGLLRHAHSRSPWHAARLAHLDVEAVDGGDLTALPVMTKADLMANWDAIVTDRRLTLGAADRHLERIAGGAGPSYLADDVHVVASGGSSGRRAVIAWDFAGFLHHHLAYARAGVWQLRRAAGAAPEGRTGRRDGRRAVVAAVYAADPVHVSAALARCFATARFPVHLLSAARPVGELAAALAALQPDHLATYPSLLSLLARRARAGGLRLRLRRITTHGEWLAEDVAREAREAFGVAPENAWGTAETAPLAVSDGVLPGLVICEDKSVIEPVDESGRPVPPGMPAARVLVTNVVNRVLPLIRYQVDDQVTVLDGANPGPWTGRRIGMVQGRTDVRFRYGTATVHPFAFRAVLGEQTRIAEYQVRQTPDGALVLVCAAQEPDLAGLARRLEAVLEAAGVADARVELRRVPALARLGESGKLRRFVPLPGAAEDAGERSRA